MKNVIILGSTGSVGENAVKTALAMRDSIQVIALAANRNAERLAEQAAALGASLAVLSDESCREKLKNLVPAGCRAAVGKESLCEAASLPEADLVLLSIVGTAGLFPAIAAVKAHKTLALASKEIMVMAGRLVTELADREQVRIIPVDSEHSAIFQCLEGRDPKTVRHLILTASGGPFLRTPASELAQVTVAEATNHPRWKMGRKITVDSSTLMNKGFEMIEACWLFGVDISQITVVIHPQSIIHSMVSFQDGAVMAQMSTPDMRLPIQYALTYPVRMPLDIPRLDFYRLGGFTFAEPDTEKFPCLAMAVEAMHRGGNIPCAMNAANEVAVDAFLNGEIKFTDIPAVIRGCIDRCDYVKDPDLNAVLDTDKTVRDLALKLINRQ